MVKTYKIKAMTGSILIGLFLITAASQMNLVAAAGDDGFEDNDSIYTSAKISEGKYTLVSWDQDYYNITVPANYSLRVYLTYDNGQYMNVQIYNGYNFGLMNSSISYSGEIEVRAMGQNVSMNQIINASGYGYGFQYMMSLELIPFSGYDDLFEPNDNQQTIPIKFPVNNTFTHLVLADIDWYRFSLSPNLKYHLLIQFTEPSYGITLRFFNNSGWMFNDSTYDYEYSRVFDYNVVGSECNFSIESGMYYSMNYYSIQIQGSSDDIYEENDNMYSAYYLSSGFYGNLSLWDEDWFYVPSLINSEINFTIQNLFDSKVYLCLFNMSDYTQIATDNIMDGQLSITFTNTGPYNQSLGFGIIGNKVGQKYGILINNYGIISDDPYEPNDNSAMSATLNTNTNYYSLVQLDYDYYNFYSTIGTFVNISVFCPNGANLNLTFLNPSTLMPEFSDSSTFDGVLNIVINSTVTGMEYFLIDGGNTGIQYNIYIQPMTGDDGFEDNDATTTAKYIGEGYYGGLISKDADFYNISISNVAYLNIVVSCPSINSFNLALYNPQLSTIRYDSSSSDGLLKVGIALTWLGVYCFQVSSDMSGAQYTINIMINYEDGKEENDNINSSSYLDLGENNGLCSLDQDWYHYYASPSQTITFRMNFTVITDFQLLLYKYYNFTFKIADYSYSDGILEVSDVTSEYTDYYIGVMTASGNYTGEYYNILLQSTSYTPPSQDDGFEENDAFDRAKLLSSWRESNLIQRDNDWFYWYLNQTGLYQFSINWSADYIFVEIISPNGEKLANSNYYGLKLSINFTAETVGDYYFHFSGPNIGAQYSIEVKYLGPAPNNTCIDDQYEDNDTPENAKYLSFPVNANLTLCDADYYRTYIDGGKTVRVIIRVQMNTNAKLVLVDQANNYTIVSFDDTTYDGELSFQVNFTTGKEIVFGFLPRSTNTGKVSYTIEAYYLNDTSSSNNLENPFGELPGYPIEFIGTISIIALFVGIKKQKRKTVQ